MPANAHKLVFDGAASFAHLRVLAEQIGPRHAGSSAEHRAAAYIEGEFRKLGLKTSRFRHLARTFSSASASLFFPGFGKVACLPFACSRSTPGRGVTAPVLYLQQFEESCINEDFRGRIVIASDRPISEKAYAALIRAQPAGVVCIDPFKRDSPFRGQVRPGAERKHGVVPMVSIAYDAGAALVRKRPAICTMKTATSGARLGPTYNVLGELRGTALPDEAIVVGSHYDTVWGTQGAQDNAGGTAIMLELARLFKASGSRRTLRFIAFSAEEIGLHGSVAYVGHLKRQDTRLKKNRAFLLDGRKSELDRILFMVNIDVQGTVLGRNAAFACGQPDVAASVRLLSNELGEPIAVSGDGVYSSDNAAFGKAGIPSLSFARRGATGVFGHSDGDSIEHCSPEGLASSGRFIAAWMQRYVNGGFGFPFPREVPDELKEKIDKYFRNEDVLAYPPEASPGRTSRPRR